MRITRKAFIDALGDMRPASRELMKAIKVKLANSEPVIIEEPGGKLSLLKSNGPGKFKTTPIADE